MRRVKGAVRAVHDKAPMIRREVSIDRDRAKKSIRLGIIRNKKRVKQAVVGRCVGAVTWRRVRPRRHRPRNPIRPTAPSYSTRTQRSSRPSNTLQHLQAHSK